MTQAHHDPDDLDPQGTQEWLDALDGVIRNEGEARAHYLVSRQIERALEAGIDIPYSANTQYINTIPVSQQPSYPGDINIELRIHAYIRWNAMAMVVRPF